MTRSIGNFKTLATNPVWCHYFKSQGVDIVCPPLSETELRNLTKNPRLPKKTEKSNVGSTLKKIIARELPGAMACGDCRKLVQELNQKTPAEVLTVIDDIANDVFNRSAREAPRLWQRLAVRLDTAVKAVAPQTHSTVLTAIHGVPVNTTETVYRIKCWIQEACDTAVVNTAITPTKHIRRIPHHSGNFGSAFRGDGSPPRFISSARFQQDIKTLVGLLPADITGIVGVARSGLSAATMAAMYLQLPLLAIRQTKNDIIEAGNGWRLGGHRHIEPKGRVVVIDDTVMTGNSLRAINPLVQKHYPGAVTAAVYVNPRALKKPDIWAVNLPWPHLLEWNMFNSVLSPSLALDFDGILCQNCSLQDDDDGARYLKFIENAKPLYTPRKCAIPLIVTARIEKYREPTLQWLRRHRITVQKLVMHPADTLAARNRDDICTFKARHYGAWASQHRAIPGPAAFVESEDWQAKRIATLSRRIVICPASEQIY